MPASDPQTSTREAPPTAEANDRQPPRRLQFRLRTLFVVTTVLCILLSVPTVAWLLGLVAAYFALSFVVVGVLIIIQAQLFLLLDVLGWLPSTDDRQSLRQTTLAAEPYSYTTSSSEKRSNAAFGGDSTLVTGEYPSTATPVVQDRYWVALEGFDNGTTHTLHFEGGAASTSRKTP